MWLARIYLGTLVDFVLTGVGSLELKFQKANLRSILSRSCNLSDVTANDHNNVDKQVILEGGDDC